MRKINGKAFLGLLIGTAALTGTVFAVHYFQYQRIARALLWQARHAEGQVPPQVARMALYLQRYLEFNPLDNDEKVHLARTWAGDDFAGDRKRRSLAKRLLEEVLIREDQPELRRLLIKVALELKAASDLKTARDHLNRLLPWAEVERRINEDRDARAAGKLPRVEPSKAAADQGELEGFWGQLLEAEENKVPQAIGCYRLAVRHAPEQQTNPVRLAYLLRRLPESDSAKRRQNHKEADDVIDALVEANKTSHGAFLARWRYRRDFDLLKVREAGSRGQVELKVGAEDVAAARRLKPESVDVLLASADLERLRGRSEAEKIADPEKQRKVIKEHRDRAYDCLRRGLELVGKQGLAGEAFRFPLLWHRANLLLDDLDQQAAGRTEVGPPASALTALRGEISAAIEQVRRTRVPAAAEYLQGRLLVHERRWGEATNLFERAQKLLAPQPDLRCQANLYLGRCYERVEEHQQMYEAYRRVLDTDPTSVPAHLGMAAARWAQGQLKEAQAKYLELMGQKQVPARVWIDIVRLELERQAQQDRPDWTGAGQALDEAEKANPTAVVEVALLRAELSLRRGEADKAEEVLEAARARSPKEAELWTALADLALRKNEKAKAHSILVAARAKLGDQVPVRLAQARYLVAVSAKEAPPKITALAKGLEKFGEEDRACLLSGLASAQMRAGDEGAARALWQQLAELPRQKHDLRLRLLLFDLALKAGKEAEVDQALADIRAAEQSSGTFHRYGQALKLIWQARARTDSGERRRLLAQAREHLDRVKSQRPSWPPIFLARSEIAELSGNTDQALKDLQEAVNKGEKSPGVMRKLVTLLTQKGRYDEADEVLKQVRRSELASMGQLEALVALGKNELQRAVDAARMAVRGDTNDPRQLVWMGRLLAKAGRHDEAQEKLEKAVKLAGAEPMPWVALVQLLAERKKRADALEKIEEAKGKIARDRAPLALAACYEAVGQPAEVLRYCEQALKAKPDDVTVVRAVASFHLNGGRLQQAEPLLRKLAEGKLKDTSDSDRAWARRGLAMVLASGTDYARFAEALKLVGLELDAAGRLKEEKSAAEEGNDGQRARARVLASQGQRQFRQKAIELLEGLAKKRALSPDDQYVLALLYDAEGKADRAREKLQELAQLPTHTPQYLAQYAMTLIARRKEDADLDEAERMIGWLAKLEKDREVGPNEYASVELRARLLEARGKGKEAEKLLRAHAGRARAKPEEVLLVLASLTRQKRYAESFALCERVWEEGKCKPEAIGGVSVALLRVLPDLTDAQAEQVEQHLLSAIEANPKSTVLLMHLSDLYDKRGEFAKAEKTYRAVLAKEPNNVVALNNLAWMLATRGGDATEALRHINTAVSGMGRRADLLDTRGLVYLALKQHEKALADLAEAASDAPTPTRLFHLARAQHETRRPHEAIRTLREAKKKGLDLSKIHPIERDECRKLLAEYSLR